MPLAQLMHQYLLENPLPVEVVVPVPLYQGRVRERGYNQAALLARELGQEIGLPVEESLIRVRDTAPQVGLPASQRRENVRNAFLCQGLGKERVLLIDDVCTTGATLEACAVALREGGAQSVWALVLARER